MTIKLKSGQLVFYRTRSQEGQKAISGVIRLLLARKIEFEVIYS